MDAQNDNMIAEDKEADDNVIQPFELEASSLRGRVVRLGSVIHDVLEAHQYPDVVAHLVAETMTLTMMLSSMLKYEGIFTLQTKGDGPIHMIVADVTSDGMTRACATYDQEALEKLSGGAHSLKDLLGQGHVAFTVDQGQHTERYQGIVELKGDTMIECVQHYFEQSEQIDTDIHLAVGQKNDRWRAGGIMVQRMPDIGGHTQKKAEEDAAEDWARTTVLMDTVKDSELLADDLHSTALLTRLFHEEGIRVFEPVQAYKGCRCSEERVEIACATLSEEDLEEMSDDGQLSMKCEFCSTEYIFDLETVRAKLKS